MGDADDRVAVTSGGVHLNKLIAESESAVPVVKYEIRSVRDDASRVTVTDDVPEDLALDDVGFHDENHGEHWTHAGAHTIRFETELAAEETVTMVYGVRRDVMDDPSAFLDRPELSVASTGSDTDATAAAPTTADEGEESTSEASPSSLSLDDPSPGDDLEDTDSNESELGDDDDVGAGDDAAVDDSAGPPSILESPDTPALGPEDAKADADGSPGATDGSETDDGGTLTAVDGDGGPAMVEAFVAALRSDTVDAETRTALGEELNLELSASTSQFVEHLQSRAREKRGQLEADIERLEDSIAELYGTKADAATVATLDRKKADSDDVDAVRKSLAELEDAAATKTALAGAEAEFDDRLGELAGELEALAETTATADALESVADDLAALDGRTPELSAFESLREDHGDLQADVATLSSSLEEETSALAADMNSEMRAVRSEIDDLEALLSERMERERGEIEAGIDALDDAKAEASALSDAADRVDALASSKAGADRVASVESTLDEEYVTEADITDAIEGRMKRSLRSRTLLVAGGAAAGGGVALAATGVTAGAALVVSALAAFAYWWYLNATELAPSTPGNAATDSDDATGSADALAATEDVDDPPELAAANDADAAEAEADAAEDGLGD